MRTVSLLSLAALASLVHADPSPMAQAKEIAAKYRTAMMTKDFMTVDKDATPGFTLVYPDGEKATKAQFLANTKAFFGPLAIKSLKVTVLSAKRIGNAKLYKWNFDVVATMRGKGPKPSLVKNHADVRIPPRSRRVEAWTFDSGKCLVMATTIDGKPMR